MTDGQKTSGLDRELARRFEQLRREDNLAAPPFPLQEELLARAAAPAASARRIVALSIAAGVAAALVLAVVLVPEPQAPDLLYRDIMSANVMITDQLLQVSPETLPGLSELPQLYDIGPPVDSQQRFN